MSSYLTTATNGPFETRFGELANGLPEYNAVDPDVALRASEDTDPDPDPDVAWQRLEPQGEIVEFFSDLYGRYPFSSVGAIIDWAPTSAMPSSRRPSPTIRASPAPRPSSTRSPTSGSATR